MFAGKLVHLHNVGDSRMMLFGDIPETVAGFYDIPGDTRLFFVLFEVYWLLRDTGNQGTVLPAKDNRVQTDHGFDIRLAVIGKDYG